MKEIRILILLTKGRKLKKIESQNKKIVITSASRYDWAPTTKKIFWTGSSVQSKCSSVPSVPSVLSVLSVELIFVRQKKSFEPVQHLHISSVQVFKCSTGSKWKFCRILNMGWSATQNLNLTNIHHPWSWLWVGRLPKHLNMTSLWSSPSPRHPKYENSVKFWKIQGTSGGPLGTL